MKTRQINKSFIPTSKPSVRSFTLLELIIVIVIIGILATLGLTQYTDILEKARLAEAIVNIAHMRLLATEYYLKNGSIVGVQNSDVGVDDTCRNTSFYKYKVGYQTGDWVSLEATRCTVNGKPPNGSEEWVYYVRFVPATGQGTYFCVRADNVTGCFGLLPRP